MEFSPDSTLLLVVLAGSGVLEARSLVDEKWVCKIVDASCGILHALWTPDSRRILAFSDF